MAAFIKMMPRFQRGDNLISMHVPEGIFIMFIRPYYITFELQKSNGENLKRDFFHQHHGAMPEYHPYDEMGNYSMGAHGGPREAAFYASWRAGNTPERMQRGLLLTNIYNQTEDSMNNGNEGTSLSLKAGEEKEYFPFPVQMPEFSVRLTLVNE